LVVGVALLSVATWASVVLGAIPVSMPADYVGVAAICTHLALLGLAFGFLALGVGAATGSRGTAGGVSAAVALFSYLMNSFAPAVEGLEPYRVASLLYYYNGSDPLVNGFNPTHLGVLAGFGLLCLVVGWWAFRRRDLRS
jgi:ABC-2 type transport system permease protein